MLILEDKLRVNQQQRSAIEAAIRTVQFIRNKALRLWMDGRGVGWAEHQRLCAHLAKEYPFAAKVHSNARQASADRAWASVSRFYKNCRGKKPGKKGAPRFQKDTRSGAYQVGGWKLEPDGKRLTFRDGTGIGTVRLIGTRRVAPFPVSQMKRVRLLQRADGYYVQFAVQAERQIEQQPPGKQVGIDVGLKSFYTDSDGQTVEHPRYLRKAEKKLVRLHRRGSRKVKRSKNRRKAIKRLAKGYRSVRRQRKDFAAKAASALVKSSDFIAYEALSIAHLVKTQHLAKSIRDASWGLFLSWIRSYGGVHSIPIVAVSPRYTSQDCSGGGDRVQKALSQRTPVCPTCGLMLDRDHNAALTILESALCTAGQAGTGSGVPERNASGQSTAGKRKRLRSAKLAG